MVATWSEPELEQLEYHAEENWAWQFPGWKWVAERVNSEFGNSRTAAACRARSKKLHESRKAR